jgi:hypothetical protein
MTNLLPRVFSVLAIAGGVAAVVLFASQLPSMQPNLFGYLGVLFYSAVACWGVFAGILLLERNRRARWHNIRFWALQVPVIFLPGIGHKLGIGAFLFAWAEYPLRVSFFFGTGAQFQFRLFSIESPIIVGVNLVALALVIWFYRSIPETASNPSIERTASGEPEAAAHVER